MKRWLTFFIVLTGCVGTPWQPIGTSHLYWTDGTETFRMSDGKDRVAGDMAFISKSGTTITIGSVNVTGIDEMAEIMDSRFQALGSLLQNACPALPLPLPLVPSMLDLLPLPKPQPG